MNEILKTTLIGLFFGTFGTTIGGLIGIKFKNPSKKFLSFILAFASGLMLAIVCFDLLPEAFGLSSLPTAFLGIILGILAMIFCDILVDKKFNTKFQSNKNTLLKTGIIVSIGLALHNFPEGLAIGSGFGASHTMEYSFSSFAVSQFAKHLGKEDDYKLLSNLSNGWKNLYDPETRLIRPKDRF